MIKRGSPISLSRKGSGKTCHRFEDEYGELDSPFMDRPTTGGEAKGYLEGPPENKGGSVPGQSKSSSVRRTRRYDFELEANREEKDRHICTIPRIVTQAWVQGMHPPGEKVSSTVESHPVRGGMIRMIIVEK